MNDINQKALQMTKEYYVVESNSEDEVLLKTYAYHCFCIRIAVDELKQSIKGALPKWLKWMIV